MARSQEELQAVLESLEGVTGAYFQKPLNLQLVPDYIVYTLDEEWVFRASNKVHAFWNRYSVTIVHQDPDSPIPGLVRDLPHCRFNRKYVAAGLYHTVYVLYF